MLELWPSLHPPPSPDPSSEQTMAETFVSMYLDLTSITQLLDDSMSLLTESSEGLPSPESEEGESSSLEELFTTALDLDRDSSPAPSHCPASLTPPPSPPAHHLNSTYVKRAADSSPSEGASVSDTERVVIPPSILRLTNVQLRERLKGLGESPGPVTEHTRQPYLLYLAKLESGLRPQQTKDSNGTRSVPVGYSVVDCVCPPTAYSHVQGDRISLSVAHSPQGTGMSWRWSSAERCPSQTSPPKRPNCSIPCAPPPSNPPLPNPPGLETR